MNKNIKISRQSIQIKFLIIDHLKRNKWLYVLMIALIVLGIVLGFVVGFNRAENFALSDLPDAVLVRFINKDISGVSLFFSRLFSFLCLAILVLCSNCKRFVCFVGFLVFFYQSFLLGINCSILISLYNVGGIVNVVVLIFPIHFLVLLALMVWGVVCLKACLNEKNCGYGVFSLNFLKDIRFLIVVLICFAVVCFFLECLVLPHLLTPLFIGTH